jgi:micrococcal nuclease
VAPAARSRRADRRRRTEGARLTGVLAIRTRTAARALAALLLATLLGGIEIEATVVRVADGDTLTVAADARLPAGAKHGTDGDVYVRFLCVDTFEIWAEGKPPEPEGLGGRDLTAGLCPPGTRITLSDDGEAFTTDRYGRVLAFVRVGRTWLQQRLVAAGWSVYWRRYRDAPPALHRSLLKAEATARSKALGAWATRPDDMAAKAAQRPKD